MSVPFYDFASLVGHILDILSMVIPLLFTLSLLVIIWKIVDAWVIHAGEADKVEEGKKVALIGVIVLVIMSGIWGILQLLRASLLGV